MLLTRYRHEDTQWVSVPKCSEWVEGLTRFEDSEEAKELPDGRTKSDAEGSRSASRGKERGLSVSADAAGQQKRSSEGSESTQLHVRPPDAATAARQQELPADIGAPLHQKGLDEPATEEHQSQAVTNSTEQDQSGLSSADTVPQQKRPTEAESSDAIAKKQRVDDRQYTPSAQVEDLQD